MKDLLEISCGLDVHKEKIVACILTGPLGKPTRSEIREFSTLIPDMIALRNVDIFANDTERFSITAGNKYPIRHFFCRVVRS